MKLWLLSLVTAIGLCAIMVGVMALIDTYPMIHHILGVVCFVSLVIGIRMLFKLWGSEQ